MTLAVTLLLPQGAFSALAAEEDSTAQTVTVSVSDEAGLIAALQNEATDVVVDLENDISISTAGTSTTGLHMSGTSEKIPYVNEYGYTDYYTEITIYSRTIHGNGYSISVDDGYTASNNSALIYMDIHAELNLYDVTLDGGRTDRCIYVGEDCTLNMYDGTVIQNGGGAVSTNGSGLGIKVDASNQYPSTVNMYEGSAVKDCVGAINGSNVNGIGIYASYAELNLYGEISGCSVTEPQEGTVTANVYGGALCLYYSSNAYIYDTAKIQDNSVLGTEGAACGGAVYVANNSYNSIYMYGGTVSGNTAFSGGAFYFAGYGNFYLQGGEISSNTADGGTGGAVYLSANTSLLIQDLQSDVSVTGNTASRDSGDGAGFGKGAGFYSIISGKAFTIDTGSSGYSVSVTDNYDIVTTTDEDGNTTQTSQTRDDIFQLYNPLDVSGSVEVSSIRMNEDAYLTLDGALTGGSIGIYPLDTADGAVVAKSADGYCITGSDLNRLYSTDVTRSLTFDSDSNVIAKAVSDTDTTDLSGATLNVSGVTYTGAAQEPTVSVLLNGSYLEEGTDFYTVYQDNTDAGTATVYVVGEGNYTGLAGTTFVIAAKDITDEDVTLADLGTYYTADGTSELEPDVDISFGDLSLETGTDYTLSYKDNAAVGTATVTITGTGNYTGTRTTTFTIAEYELAEGQTAFMVHNQEELETALSTDSVAVILFANDISIDSKASVERDVVIDGNGNTLSASAALTISSSAVDNAILSVTSGKLTLQNITVVGGDTSMAARNLYVASGAEAVLGDTVVLTGGYSTTGTAARNLGTTIHNEGTLTLDGCTIRDAVYDKTVVTIYNSGELTMEDGTEITNVGGRYGVIYLTGDFTMDGGTFTAGYESAPSFTSTNAVFLRSYKGSTFTMNGGTIDGMLADGETYVSASAAMVYNYQGTFTMNGGTVCHYGGSSYAVRSTGTFTMKDSTIADNSKGVSNTGTFTMDSGTIANNTSRGVYSEGTFTMNGGTIENNEVYGSNTAYSGIGAGVYLYAGTFTMNGGTIQNNTAYMLGSYAKANTAAGAGIYDYNAAMTLNGGSITGNSIVVNQTDVDSYGDTSGRGAGIYIEGRASSSLDIAGTTISGNKIYTVEAGADDDSEKAEASFAGTGIFVYNVSATAVVELSISGSGDISITDAV
ncbi:MAG: hypothetical protein LUG54_01725, partial [Clostridiales bacterium]|nr:hypothetical protein [Clostridiales bacterium]